MYTTIFLSGMVILLILELKNKAIDKPIKTRFFYAQFILTIIVTTIIWFDLQTEQSRVSKITATLRLGLVK